MTSIIQHIDLWHAKMGHLFADKLDVMKQKHTFMFSNKSFICNACHLAK